MNFVSKSFEVSENLMYNENTNLNDRLNWYL